MFVGRRLLKIEYSESLKHSNNFVQSECSSYAVDVFLYCCRWETSISLALLVHEPVGDVERRRSQVD